MKKLLLTASAAGLLAGAAQAASLNVMVWDVLAPEPGCCTGNNEDDQNAQTGKTLALENGEDANFFNGAFLGGGSNAGYDEAGVDHIVNTVTADLSFSIDSSALTAGFLATGLSSTSSSPRATATRWSRCRCSSPGSWRRTASSARRRCAPRRCGCGRTTCARRRSWACRSSLPPSNPFHYRRRHHNPRRHNYGLGRPSD